MCGTFGSPDVHKELLGLLSVEGQVVAGAPLSQVLNLFPVGRLIVVADEANHRCVVCKLETGVKAMYRCAVVGKEGVEDKGSAHSPVEHRCLV